MTRIDGTGHIVGHVRAVEPADGEAHAIDVALAQKGGESVGQEDVWLGATSIVSAENEIILNDQWLYLLHPELRVAGVLSDESAR